MGRNLGDTIWVEFDVTDKRGAPLDEFMCEVVLYDPHWGVKDTNINPRRIGMGRYEAKLQIPKNGIPGVWKVKIFVTKDGTEENEPLTFYVNP